ncbi:MAG: LysM peptidoglycan-binding domain-containing protein, partial [Actinomycetota bacterium]
MRRPLVTAFVAAIGGVGLLSLTACGSDPSATATTLRPLTSTNYATTPPSVVTTVDPANTLPPPLTYTVAPGDSMYGIASKFGTKA